MCVGLVGGLWLWLGCAGGTSPPPVATDSAPEELIAVPYRRYDEPSDCWHVEYEDRPAELWGNWVENCNSGEPAEPFFLMSTVDGDCVFMYGWNTDGVRVSQCEVNDPDWLVDCSLVAGCCDWGERPESTCY